MDAAHRRFLIAMPLAIAFGFLCAFFASTSNGSNFWGSSLMWEILSDRFVIWVLVFLAWAYKTHPILRFRLYPWLRWMVMWLIGSLPLAIGAFISPSGGVTAVEIFFWTMILGWIYGSIIDICATKWGGEGKELLK